VHRDASDGVSHKKTMARMAAVTKSNGAHTQRIDDLQIMHLQGKKDLDPSMGGLTTRSSISHVAEAKHTRDDVATLLH